jgi:hypothetical protein
MSIVIGEFEVINEPDTGPAPAESGNQAQPASAHGVTPEAIARVEQHLAERALRVWAD